MHTGNGEWRELPIPKGADGSAVTYSYGGRCAILRVGEGYEIRDGNIVFDEPPPNGAVVAVGSAVGTFGSTEAIAQIVDGLKQMTALLEGARLFVTSTQDEIRASMIEFARQQQTERTEALATLDAKFKNALTVAARDVRAELEADFDEVRKLCKQAEEDREACARAEASLDKRIDEANKDFDRALENCFAREGRYHEECEMLEAVIAEAKESLTKTKAEGIENINSAFADVTAGREKMFAEYEELRGRLDGITSMIDAVTARAGRIIGKRG